MTENVHKKKISFSELSKERADYLLFIDNNYDELVELCNLGQLEQSIFMAPTNITFLGGINDFKKDIQKLKDPITNDMIEDLNYNYEFIVQAKLGAYHDIRKCLYLDTGDDAKNIDVRRYEKLCSLPTPKELRKSKIKNN